MPLFAGSPVAAYSAIVNLRDPVVLTLTADISTTLLAPDNTRKGHITKNTGNTNVTIFFGLADPADTVEPFTYKEFYRFTLKPGEAYLYDIPEIFPYQAVSPAANGQLTIIEAI